MSRLLNAPDFTQCKYTWVNFEWVVLITFMLLINTILDILLYPNCVDVRLIKVSWWILIRFNYLFWTQPGNLQILVLVLVLVLARTDRKIMTGRKRKFFIRFMSFYHYYRLVRKEREKLKWKLKPGWIYSGHF